MNKLNSFKDMTVWQEASKLAKDIATKLVRFLPRSELYKLGDQMIRSSRSVPSQIAEGFRKSSLREKNRFYEIALTSNDETENHLIEAKNNEYVDEKTFKSYTNRIIRVRILLLKLMKSVRAMQARASARRVSKRTCKANVVAAGKSGGSGRVGDSNRRQYNKRRRNT